MPDLSSLTPEVVANYGALTIFFLIVMTVFLHWYLKVRPAEVKSRNQRDDIMLAQVTLATKAIETSNLVIERNTDEMRESRGSHVRLGERMGCLETTVHDHDKRAEQIAKDVAIITARLEG